MTEPQTCGRRMTELGPWDRKADQDTWQTDRWAATPEEADSRAADFLARHPGGSMTSMLWEGPGPAPRTCSFCGGVHPEDAIVLVRDHGWEVAATGKPYKRYLEPPGHREFIQAREEASVRVRGSGLGGVAARDAIREQVGKAPWAPVPPVKLYVQHFEPEQAARLNAAIGAEE